MKKFLFVIVLVASIYFPLSYSELSKEKITITVDNDGNAKVVHKIDTETLLSNISVQPISDKISKKIAFDENNVLLKIRPSQNQTRIDSLGASVVTFSYDADIVTKNSRIWKIEYQSNSESKVILPPTSQIVSFNKIPLDIVDDVFVMQSGNISISFIVESLKTHKFTINEGGNIHQITIITSSNIRNFIQESKAIQFDVDDDTPMMALVPKVLVQENSQILFNNEKMEFKKFNQNSTHYWIRLDPRTSGTFYIMPLQSSESADALRSSGGCLIATATYGTELSSQVQSLRELRDNVVSDTNSGKSFMVGFDQFYYSFSPTIADWERQSPLFKEVVKITIIPILSTLSILNYVDIDSESEMLGYGIGIILLNVGLYVGMPTFLIIKIRKWIQNNPKMVSESH
jgi:hypothetical protein